MIEKERKFILKELPPGLTPISIQQGYLMFEGKKHLRVRVVDNKNAFLTYKIVHEASFRTEYEYEIPLADGLEMLAPTTIKLNKIRYKTKFKNYHVDIDFFENGLEIVEIEFEGELEFIPDYCGEEVTGKNEYTNIAIALRNIK